MAEPPSLEARVHGGLDPVELARVGLRPEQVVDFSVNINPYGPPPWLLEALHTAAIDRYPDPHATAAREAWGRTLERDRASVCVGHGAADLFWAIARAVLERGDRVVIAEPTFSEYRVAAAAAGARVERVFAAGDLAIDVEALARAGEGARSLYLCSPNNPTGEHLSTARVRALAQALPHTTLVLDQSFLALSDYAEEQHAQLPDNVIAVRSLTKEYCCPGLRLGLCLAHPALIARIERARPTWATSSLALAALEACARHTSFVRESFARLRSDRDAVTALLRARGYRTHPSATTFQLVALDHPACELRRALLAQGVSTRDCASFGLPQHLRLAALPAPQRERLAHALDAVRAP